MMAAMRRGAEWEFGKIDADGEVSVEGNTRTGLTQERNKDGSYKGVNYGEIVQAMYYTCNLLKEPRGCDAGRRVFQKRYGAK
jgi:hypothetical protein